MGSPGRWGLVASTLLVSCIVVAAAPALREAELRFPGHEPSVRWDDEGKVHMVFARDEGSRQQVFYSKDGGAPRAISPEDLRVDSRGEMGPSLEILPNKTLVVVYTAAVPAGERASELMAQRSADAGATWSKPVAVNDDGRSGSHGFASTAVDSSGRLLVAWLDHRSGQQGVAFASSQDGARFSANRTADPKTCQCCRTDVAAGPSGKFWVAYRGLSGTDLRDITIVRGEAPTFELSSPMVVSTDDWHINGCPESGPRMAVEKDGTLWIVWYTGSGPGVFVARSKDGGRTFSSRVKVAPAPGETSLANHPDIAVLPDGRVLVVFQSRGAVYARTLARGREAWSAAVRLAEPAAYPRISARAGKVAVSFTGRSGNDTVAAAMFPAMDALDEGMRKGK